MRTRLTSFVLCYILLVPFGNLYASTLSGDVEIEGRTTYEGVKIMVGKTNFQTVSGSTGTYSISGIPNGKYRVYAQSPGCLIAVEDITMTGMQVNLNFKLIAGDLVPDGEINLLDRVKLTEYWGFTSSDPSWNDTVDLWKDGVIDEKDKALIVKYWGYSSKEEVGIPGELTIIAPLGGGFNSPPESIQVDVQRIDPNASLEPYTVISPVAPIYRVELKSTELAQPVRVRVPASNIHLPEGVSLEDLQIVTWRDWNQIEFLPTTVAPDGGWLEAIAPHFSYFTVRLKPTISLFGGSEFVITKPLRIALEGDRLTFDNLFSDVVLNWLRWLVVEVSYPQSLWINYQVEVLRDGLITDEPIATMQVFRIVWSPADVYDVDWAKPALKADSLPGRAFRLQKSGKFEAKVMGKEIVVVFDGRGQQIERQESVAPPQENFLSEVFGTEASRRFLPASFLNAPSAHYFLRITRQYEDWLFGASNTVVSDKFSPYDIAPFVTLKEPGDQTEVQTKNPEFDWQSVALPGVHVNHELLIARHPNPHLNPEHRVPTGSGQGFFNGEGQVDRLTLEPGDYYWRVRAYTYDGKRERAFTYSDVWTFRIAAPEPTARIQLANFSEGETIYTKREVILDGRQSADPNSELLTFIWSPVTLPSGQLSSETGPRTSFTPTKPGKYTIALTVKNAHNAKDTVTMTINVVEDRPPVVDARVDLKRNVGDTITIQGSATDPEGQPLTYQWVAIGGPAVEFKVSKATLTFTPIRFGEYQFRLIADDGYNKGWDDVLITVDENQKPVAVVGPDQVVNPGTVVTLDGSRSKDPEDATLTYLWTVISEPSGSSIILSDKRSPKPTFTPQKHGEYTFKLVVNDSALESDPAYAKVIVTQYNTPGNTLVAFDDKAVEFDPAGNEVWSFSGLAHIRDADRLPNGNTLIAGSSKVIEVNYQKTVVWGKSLSYSAYEADRLDNGNTLVLGEGVVVEFNTNGDLIWSFLQSKINSQVALDHRLEGAQFRNSIERLAGGNTLIAISHPSAYAIEVTPEQYISAIYLKEANGVSAPVDVAGFDKLSTGDILLALNGHPVHGSSIMVVDDADLRRFEWTPRGYNGYQVIFDVQQIAPNRLLYVAWGPNEVVEFDIETAKSVNTLTLNARSYSAGRIGVFNRPGKDRNFTPETVIKSGPSGTIEHDDPSFSWSGSDSDGAVVGYYYQMDSGERQFTTSSSRSFYNIGYGSHTLRVWAKDNYGAFDPTPAERSFYSKAPPPTEPPPVVQIKSPSDGAVVG